MNKLYASFVYDYCLDTIEYCDVFPDKLLAQIDSLVELVTRDGANDTLVAIVYNVSDSKIMKVQEVVEDEFITTLSLDHGKLSNVSLKDLDTKAKEYCTEQAMEILNKIVEKSIEGETFAERQDARDLLGKIIEGVREKERQDKKEKDKKGS